MTIPSYTATDEQVEEIRRESAPLHRTLHAKAARNVEKALENNSQELCLDPAVPSYEVIVV